MTPNDPERTALAKCVAKRIIAKTIEDNCRVFKNPDNDLCFRTDSENTAVFERHQRADAEAWVAEALFKGSKVWFGPSLNTCFSGRSLTDGNYIEDRHTVSVVRRSRTRDWKEYDNPPVVAWWFWPVMQEWEQHRDQAAEASCSPLCLACDAEFKHEEATPSGFLLAEIGGFEWGHKPDRIILTGICRKCAARGDDELLRIGIARLQQQFPDLFGGTFGIR